MHAGGKIEDRVFGRPELYPRNSLVNRTSRSYDLLSVPVRGAEIAYAQEGRLALPPMVFLHGWGASHKFWRPCLTAFSPRRRCIAPDLPGFGLSARASQGGHTPEAFADWVGAFFDAMGLKKAVLAGHSMGATIALLFALARPDRVERLILASPLIHGATALSSRYRFLTAPGIRPLVFALMRFRAVRESVCTDFACAGPMDDELARDITAASYRACVKSLDALHAADLRPRLSGLSVPTLVISGELDRVVDPAQTKLVPAQVSHVLPATGHLPMVERPVEFNRAVAAFLG
jgi:pimeloyl-ACP methyl ester carboxylesterase